MALEEASWEVISLWSGGRSDSCWPGPLVDADMVLELLGFFEIGELIEGGLG